MLIGAVTTTPGSKAKGKRKKAKGAEARATASSLFPFSF
jgi:hypothetical protein